MAATNGTALRCPRCGAQVGDGTEFRHVELVRAGRKVLGYAADGWLRISGEEHFDSQDDGEDGHLECHAEVAGGLCLGRVELPATLEIEWE